MHIVQFHHPGMELPVKKFLKTGNATALGNGKFNIPWRIAGRPMDNHARRLVSHEGMYVDDAGNLNNGRLLFWTEWEAATIATQIGNDQDFLKADYVHTIISPTCVQGTPVSCGNKGDAASQSVANKLSGSAGYINTDPCVLGKTFKYGICHQTANGVLRKLEPNSLIVFGAYKGNKFFLDTVFVSSDTHEDYSKDSVETIECSEEYKNLALRRVDGQFTFYRGKEYGNGTPVYSFTPARICGNGSISRGRCCLGNIESLNKWLRIPAFIDTNLRSFKCTAANEREIESVWKDIVEQVRKQEFVLGVHFDWPAKHNR